MHYYDLLIPGYLDKPYTYCSLNNLSRGQIVVVQFRNRETLAIVSGIVEAPSIKIKPIEKETTFCIDSKLMDYITWVSTYTLSAIGMITKMVLPLKPQDIEKLPNLTLKKSTFSNSLVLTSEQQQALKNIQQNPQSFNVTLLDGVTGSGKTEVYLSFVRSVLANEHQVLILLPEIVLTTQLLQKITNAFDCAVHHWHSDSTLSQKRAAYAWALSGNSGIMIGARSGLFLPYKKLALIVVDEEHDGSYKQEEQVIYHARDMAVMKAKIEDCPIILSSATPSLETFYNASQKRYQHVQLSERFAHAQMPSVQIIDMKQQKPGQWISKPLSDAIESALGKNEQSLLFLNRRGYAPLTLCRACGYRFMCPYCDICLVQHRYKNNFLCHHCGFEKSLTSCCAQCGEKDCFVACGPGVERIVEEAQHKFPNARILAITSDLMPSANKMQAAINQIHEGMVDIIVGTQVLAKGHHFPKLNLVGVVDADAGMGGGDLKGAERTYQLLHQVSGRSGRESQTGRVFLQTYMPEHPIMQSIQNFDRDSFYQLEIEDRMLHKMPPFTRLVALILSSTRAQEVESVVKLLVRNIPNSEQVRILGPAPAPIAKLRGHYRWRILVKAEKNIAIQDWIKQWLAHYKIPSHVKVMIDVDPQTFL